MYVYCSKKVSLGKYRSLNFNLKVCHILVTAEISCVSAEGCHLIRQVYYDYRTFAIHARLGYIRWQNVHMYTHTHTHTGTRTRTHTHRCTQTPVHTNTQSSMMHHDLLSLNNITARESKAHFTSPLHVPKRLILIFSREDTRLHYSSLINCISVTTYTR